MTGLRERKKRATRTAIHEAGMALFADQGFAGTTIDDIAERADVSRATVFSYFPTKEDIVFGDAPAAIDALASALRERPSGTDVITCVRTWLGQLSGWLEPGLVLQVRLMREVPTVGARRLRQNRELEDVIAGALVEELGLDRRLAARLVASSLLTALSVIEETAAERMELENRALREAEIAALLEEGVAFAEAGLSVLRGGSVR
jgi:AcrR family transcriptional regulator